MKKRRSEMIEIKGKTILDAGLIAEVISETKTRVRVKVLALFFPKHVTKLGFLSGRQRQPRVVIRETNRPKA